MARTLDGVRLALVSVLLGGCSLSPPASQIPSPEAAIERIRATAACGTGVQASAKIDHFGEHTRVRGDLLLIASRPARIRMDVVSPFGVALATLASDGDHFSLADLRERRFYEGPASACNIARLTTVPVPAHVLGELLRGQPPVLVHPPGGMAMVWSGKGRYVVTIRGTRNATEELQLAPHPDDWGLPWTQQRLRLVDVKVTQAGDVLYHAELAGHAPAATAGPRVDPDGVDPPLPPSGPPCTAEIPRRIRMDVPSEDENVVFRYDQVVWNPPIPEGTFTQQVPPGMAVVPVTCE